MYRICKALMVTWTIICALGLLYSLGSIPEIETENEFEEAGAAIGTALGVGFWVALWFFPTVGMGVLALVTKPGPSNAPAASSLRPSPKLCPDCGKYYVGTPTYCPNCGGKIATPDAQP